MCVAQTMVLFLSLSGSGRGYLNIYKKVQQQCWKEWAGWHAKEGVLNSAISASTLADFLVHLFRVGLAWYTICITVLLFHPFCSLIVITNYYPIISKLMHCFSLQHPLHINGLIHWMLNVCYLCNEVGIWPFFLLILNFLGIWLLFKHFLQWAFLCNFAAH